MQDTPNLFNYATKELSQDAVICWLIEWAGNDADAELHGLGRSFVEALLAHRRQAGRVKLGAGTTTKIIRQDHSIDVLARINHRHVLLIEDKTGSNPHSDQLARYRDTVLSGGSRLGQVARDDLYPIYFKTGNHSIAAERKIETEGGYAVFNRSDFLEVLNRYQGHNAIVLGYRARLQDVEDCTQSFRTWQDDDSPGHWNAWEGLFRELEGRLFASPSDIDHGWHYVPNPSGGFVGFYWYPEGVETGDADTRLFLQLEWGHLCFKVGTNSSSAEKQRALRSEWHKRITRQHEKVVKPPRFGRGYTMTVAMHDDGYLRYGENGLLDLDATVGVLRDAEQALLAAAT